jgi:uncharacterized protein (DUF1501 family)
MVLLKKSVKRRDVLKLGLQGVAALYGASCIAPDFAWAAGGTAPRRGKTIVLLIKSGGQDMVRSMPYLNAGLATEFRSARPSLHIEPGNALNILNGQIGLHANYSALTPIAQAGKLKIITSCGFEEHSGSHEDATSHMSHGARHLTGKNSSNGWIGKTKDHFGLDEFTVIGFGTTNRLDLRGSPGGIALSSNLSNFNYLSLSSSYGGSNNSSFAQEIRSESLALFGETGTTASGQIKSAQDLVSNSITKVGLVQAQPLTTTFPTGTLATNFANAAKFLRWNMINNPNKNSLLVLTQGGYDTHENEAVGLDELISIEGNALKAFYDEMSSAGLLNSVAVVSISEFSRTLRENSGLGTDHAKATNIMLMGGGVNGSGQSSVYGELATASDITNRNYIPTSVHYHDVVKELLVWWGASLNDVDVIVPEKPPVSNALGLFV